MNKDLSKEYKEAVMNDLPDLWGRIEAAIDAEESTKTNGNETPVSNVIQFSNEKTTEKNTVNTANKYAVNAFDNEPVKAQTKKKKKGIPSWVFVAVPSAAILLLVIIPVGFMMMMGGLGRKSATTTANYAAEASPVATANSTEPSAFYDSAATYDEAAAPEEAYEYEDSTQEYKNATSAIDLTGGNGKLEGLQGIMENFDGTKSDSATALAPTETNDEPGRVINDSVTVKFLSVYENDGGKKLADVEIVGVYGDYFVIPEDFDGFEAGELITAYLQPDFKDVDFNGEEYNCIINYIPDDEICYEIEFRMAERIED